MTNRVPWNKGKQISEESKEKMRQAKLGKKMSDSFKEKRKQIMIERWKDPIFIEDMKKKHSGENNCNYGKLLSSEQKTKLSDAAKNRSPEWKEKQKLAHQGNVVSEETKKKMSDAHSRDKCYNWKGGITPVYKHIRGHRKYKEWCKSLLLKFNYTDIFTKEKGNLLSCHHIIPVNTLIKINNIKIIEDALNCSLIWDINNGIVLLKKAHDKFHNLYGDNKNIFELSEDQIKELYQ